MKEKNIRTILDIAEYYEDLEKQGRINDRTAIVLPYQFLKIILKKLTNLSI